jgi:hypothetical protein
MRFPAVAVVLLVGLGVIACGDENGTPTTTSVSTALPLKVERSGGVAGIQDTLVVRPDGSGTVTVSGTDEKLAPDETTALRRAMRELVFAGLQERYVPPEGTVVSDGIDYAFTAGGRTVVVEEMADDVPGPLMRLKSAAAAVMSG